MAADTPGDGLSAAERNAELTLPGAQADPCCMGTAALESLESRLHPRGARRPEDLSFPRAARADGGGAADVPRHRVGRGTARPASSRRSLSHHGRAGLPRDLLSSAALRDGYCAALRERYHEEVCGGFNYRRASQETLDPCLQQLLLATGRIRPQNAMLCLLSGVM